MTDICLIFQVHQPYRLKTYTFEHIGKDHAWEDSPLNLSLLNRISDQCYLPACQILLNAIRKADGKFRLAFSISGVCLEQFFRYRPDVLEAFRALAATGCVEFLAETYYHSLAALYSEAEFRRQVVKHEKALQNLLDLRPTVFRNTELLYSDAMIPALQALGYRTVIAEGKAENTDGMSPDRVFSDAQNRLRILARNHQLSDDISFRFNELGKNGRHPAKEFAQKLSRRSEDKHCTCIYLDFETFGEHLKSETGIFDFLKEFPVAMENHPDFQFSLPSDAAFNGSESRPVYQSSDWTSWADEKRDSGAWNHDHMQKDALKNLYEFEFALFQRGRPEILDAWGRLQTSDHFYYMSTRFRHNPVHQVFNPFNSPYDAYLNYMNVLSDFRRLVEK